MDILYDIDNSAVPSRLDYEEMIRGVSAEILSGIDVSELVRACQQGRYDDRRYRYEDIARKACGVVFRQLGGDIYWFTGRVWSRLSSNLLYDGMRMAFVSGAEEYFGGIRSDMMKCLPRLVAMADRCPELGLSKSVVGFRNGVWDFGADGVGVYHSFDERMPVLSLLGYDYDPSAVCPVWCSFLSQVLREEQIVLLQKFLGLGCIDRRLMSHRVESTLWLIGSGANGKSTIQSVVMGVFGRDRVSTTRLDDLLNRRPDERMRSMATIMGKVFNYANEVHESDISRSADTFKSLCSGDEQSVRTLGRDIEVRDDVPFLICNMNERPEMRNLDKAIVRRLLQIKFEASVSEEDMDLELGKKLESEYSGIRNWMLEGYRRLVRDGFSFVGERFAEEQEAVMLENRRTVDLFLRAFGVRYDCRAGHLDEVPRPVLSQSLYGQYALWCAGRGYIADAKQAFDKRMRKLFRSKRVNAGLCYYVYSDGELPFGSIA